MRKGTFMDIVQVKAKHREIVEHQAYMALDETLKTMRETVVMLTQQVNKMEAKQIELQAPLLADCIELAEKSDAMCPAKYGQRGFCDGCPVDDLEEKERSESGSFRCPSIIRDWTA
jgi:hypothetical protein